MRILKSTLQEIIEALGKRPVESGGIIGCKNGCICAFIVDDSYFSQYEYRPDVAFLNGEIQKWNAEGIAFCGIVHSHLYGLDKPSESDRVYAQRLFLHGSNIALLYFPIMTFDAEGNTRIDFFKYMPEKGNFEKTKIAFC